MRRRKRLVDVKIEFRLDTQDKYGGSSDIGHTASGVRFGVVGLKNIQHFGGF